LVFAAGMLSLMKGKQLLSERMLFIFKNIPFLLIPFSAVLIAGDKKIIFFSALLIFIVTIFLIHKNKFGFQEPGSI
jgi:hypothetical protein